MYWPGITCPICDSKEEGGEDDEDVGDKELDKTSE